MPILNDRIVDQIDELLPEYISEEGQGLKSFLSAYFDFLEKGILIYEQGTDLETIGLEDGEGNLRRYSLSGSTRVYADSQAGTVDYSNGNIKVNGINILSTINTDDTIHFTVNPNSYDSVAYRSNLLDINSSLIKVTGATDTIASGDTSAGVGYTSSSSYS